MASRPRGTLYIGVTSNLVRRVWQHRNGELGGFTHRYGVTSLVYFELHARMRDAITRETQLKRWNRAWKLALVESENPEWRDLWPTLIGSQADPRCEFPRGP
jgi:putative endonuclease